MPILRRVTRRRPFVVWIGVAAVVVASAFAAGWLLGSDAGDTPATTSSTSTTLSEGDAFVAAFGQGIIAASGGVLSSRHANCITNRLIDEFGREHLENIDPADPGDDVRDTLERAYLECVPPHLLDQLGRQQDE